MKWHLKWYFLVKYTNRFTSFIKNGGPAELSRCICHKNIYITWFVFVWLMNSVCGERLVVFALEIQKSCKQTAVKTNHITNSLEVFGQ